MTNVGAFTLAPIQRQHRTWIAREIPRLLEKITLEEVTVTTDMVGHCVAMWCDNNMTEFDLVRPWRHSRMPELIAKEDRTFLPWDTDEGLTSVEGHAANTYDVSREASFESWQAARSRIVDMSDMVLIFTDKIKNAGPWITRVRFCGRDCTVTELSTKRTMIYRGDTDGRRGTSGVDDPPKSVIDLDTDRDSSLDAEY